MKNKIIITILSILIVSGCSYVNEDKIIESTDISVDKFIDSQIEEKQNIDQTWEKQEQEQDEQKSEQTIEEEKAESEIEDLIDLLLE